MNESNVETTFLTSPDKEVLIEYIRGDLEITQELRLQQIACVLKKEYILSVVKPLIEGTHTLSLRLLDFVCVNYSKKKPICLKLTMTNGHQVLWNLHQSYREWLKCWRRKNFDVFRRSKRINLTVENMKIETTCGQLNFMTWLFKYDVIDYCTKNKILIEKDMIETLNEAKEKIAKNERKRRQHITEPTKLTVNIYKTPRHVLFDVDLSSDEGSLSDSFDLEECTDSQEYDSAPVSEYG